jgi:hypothetical protein
MLLIVTAVMVWTTVSIAVGLALGGLVWLSRHPGRRPELAGAVDALGSGEQPPQARGSVPLPHPRASQDEPALDGTPPYP